MDEIGTETRRGIGSCASGLADGHNAGAVVVTSFRCNSIVQMLLIARMHRPVKRQVKERVSGFLGIKLFFDWPSRTLRSVSLWESVSDIRGMGAVDAHVKAVRVPGRFDIATAGAVFDYIGDWRNVLFGDGWGGSSPLCVRCTGSHVAIPAER